MRTTKRFAKFLFATTMLAGFSGVAAAQQAAPDDPQNSFDAVDPNAIIVTATKREESLQDVPISITALSPAKLEQNQVIGFDDFAKLLPSVSYQSFGPGQAQLYFRGITTGGDGVAVGPLPGSGLYLDDVPVTTIFSSVDIHTYDLARVEALAGPQGTLYGASSLSGTLRLITNKPDASKFSAGYDARVSKFGKGAFGGQLEGFVNIPISETIAFRASGFFDHEGGYIDNTPGTRTYLRPHTIGTDGNGDPVYADAPLTINNAALVKDDYNDVESYGGRAALGIELGDTWTATPSVLYQHQEAGGQFLFDPRAGDLENHDFVESHNRDEWYLASMTIKGQVSNWDVTATGSFFNRVVDNTSDYSYFTVAYDSYPDYNYLYDSTGRAIDPTQAVRGYDRYKKWAGELRVSSPAADRFRLTAGLFGQHQIDDRIAEYIVPGIRNAVAPFSPPVPGGGPDDVYYTTVHRVDRDYAMFGEAEFDLTPRLTLLGGIRGFIAHNTLNGFSGGIGALDREITIFGCTGTTVQQCPNIDKKYSESGETHKVSLTWKIDDDRLVYATYSTGFRPGGSNRDAFALGQLQIIPSYKADTLTNYEIGWKSQWLDRKLRINGAVFWEKWNDVQYSLPGLLGIYYTVNAGAARSRGVEGDISWTAAPGLNFSASGTYVDAQLTDPFCDQELGCDPASGGTTFAPKGTRLPITPKFKINGSIRYDFLLGGANKAFVQGNVNHQSGTSSYLTPDGNAAIGNTDQFTTFDFSAGYRFGNIGVEAFIQNAFDERGILSKNITCAPSICGAYARAYPTKPQYYGLKFSQRF